MQLLFRNAHAIGKKGRPFTGCSQEATNINAVLRAKAKGFLNIAKDGGVLRFCCLLHDTIYQLSNLSKSLQRSVSNLAEAQRCLSSKYKSRIPKRHASQEGSDCVLMQSPLSRLQDSDPASEGGQNHLMNGSPESSSSDSAGPTSDGLLSPSLKLSPHHSPSKAWKAWKPARTSAGSSVHSGTLISASGSDCSGLGPGLGGGARTADQTTPPVMELDFTDLHVGLTRARPNGTLTITEHCITLPVKGGPAKGGGECEVVVVASQVRGHGLWDGGMAGGGPAPSLLFLWVTDAQAKLLQTELSIIHPVTEPGVSCVFLLVVVSVSELQAALCLSLLDTEQYCTSSSLDLSQAMHLLSSLPPPLHTHLLLLLQPTESSNQRSRSSQVGRLIQYPAPPSKGRITVTTEDLACLQHGHFLNDVIIDFYLKYLLLEKVDAGFSECCHVFSSFFFKQLSRRRAGVEEAPAILNREMRHQRVKTWTRHVNIFTKDFLFVPVNQEAHWYLLLVCFPGLEGVQHQAWSGPVAARQASGMSPWKHTHTPSDPFCCSRVCVCVCVCVCVRACILVMDSLKLSAHENACRLLRDYLQVEWQVRRGTSRLFTADTMRSAVCRLPLQDNSSDCGLYLLQYAETFLQNPVVHFDLPVRLDGWFSRQQIRSKRDQIRSLVLDLQEDQNQPGPRL
ncbi:unnamed protein product [Merluccius merluccius]